MRVIELAREVSLPSKEVLGILHELGFASISTNFTPVPPDAEQRFRARMAPPVAESAGQVVAAGPRRISAPAPVVVTPAPLPVRQQPNRDARRPGSLAAAGAGQPVRGAGQAAGAGAAPGGRPQGGAYGRPTGPGGGRPGFGPRPGGFGAPGAGGGPGGPPRPGLGPNKKPGGGKKWQDRRKDKEGEVSKVSQRSKKKGQRNAGPTINQVVRLSGSLTVKELAERIGVHEAEVIKRLFLKGVMATINQTIPLETAEAIVSELGLEVEMYDPSLEGAVHEVEEVDEAALVTRPPVVTIMGHVDHGKTSLLDAIRNTRVAAGEAGGITQHIGAYQVEIHGKPITFLDTPGHEAFTAMRARGAKATDIAILVVAADDGVKPQTIEAINHAREAGVPIMVAINKIDKPEAQPDQVKQQLTEFGLVAEEWGGQTIMVPLSAKQRTGINELLEMILLVAEVQEFKADPERLAKGLIIEAELDPKMGPKATVLVQNGTLSVGDHFAVGAIAGKVRAMINDQGRRVKQASPAMPVVITGLSAVPRAGDVFQVYEDERKAKSVASERAEAERAKELAEKARHLTLGAISDAAKGGSLGDLKELRLVLRADVKGSLEAVTQSLLNLNKEEGLALRIILANTGEVTESDIDLANASNAIVIAFHTGVSDRARVKADADSVEIREYDVIYKLLEDMEKALHGMLEPEFEEVFTGRAEVLKIFTFEKTVIGGCMVREGKMQRNLKAKVLRGRQAVYEGKLDHLKRFKDEVKEVQQGYDCGISFGDFNDLQIGDFIEVYALVEKAR
ncbi:MAG: translation initiation factor IF-2 [Candidatus Sericytochromatia bacterium]|nr:translation initiation factor IF-2 [Candidatus Sericytochromatia bacterium]